MIAQLGELLLGQALAVSGSNKGEKRVGFRVGRICHPDILTDGVPAHPGPAEVSEGRAAPQMSTRLSPSGCTTSDLIQLTVELQYAWTMPVPEDIE